MAASKVGLQCQKFDALKDYGELTWYKYASGFPEPRTYGEEYKEWRNAMKRRMEQDRIPGWNWTTAAQWGAIQADTLATPPLQLGRHSGTEIQPGVNILLKALIFC